jgi:hypothetical protein
MANTYTGVCMDRGRGEESYVLEKGALSVGRLAAMDASLKKTAVGGRTEGDLFQDLC